MKRVIYGLATAFAAGSLLADTAVWTKTDDQVENLWGWSWGRSANWQAGYVPQTGDDVSFPTAPDAGVDKVMALVAQEGGSYGNYSIGTLTGLSSYEIVLSLGSNLTVTDPSGFYGVFKMIGNAQTSNQGYNHIQPNTLKLNATSSPVVINRYDDAFDSNIEVQNYGVEAQVLSIEHSAPGAMHKTGPGDLVAKFSQGAEHSVFADAGTLYVKENEETDFSLGHATVSQGASLGVKSGETAAVSSIVAYGGTLNKVGDGDLRVGAISARDADGQYDTGSAANVVVRGGSFGTTAAVEPPLSGIVTTPYLSLDASAANAFEFDENDSSLITKWNDVVAAGRYVTGLAAEGDGGTGRLPRFVANAIGDKPVVDFGTFQYHTSWDNTTYYAGDGTAGCFQFPDDQHSIAAFFMVFKKNSVDRPAAFFGAHKDWSWNDHFKWQPGYSVDNLLAANGWNQGSSWVAVADWRVDGVRVDMEKYRLHSDDYHLISFAAGDAPPTQQYLGANASHGQFGGLSIAEVVIYDTPLAAGEREAIEAYLMDKWLGKKLPVASESVAVGTLTYPTAGDMEIETGKDLAVGTLDGSGTVVKKGSGRLSIAAQGGISGVDVQAGELDFAIAASSGELTILDDAWFHMDPSVASSLTTNEEGRVTLISDVDGRAVSAGPTLVHQTKSEWANHVAGPTIVEAPNTGLNLLDFGPYSYGAWNAQSCGMMISAQGEISSSDADVAKYNFRTALAVVEKISDASNDRYAFLGGRAWSFTYSTQGKICDDAAPAIGGVGTWMLDGEVCNPATTDWRADGLHVIAFTLPSDTQVLINLLGQENDKDSADHMGGLRYGEVLIFRNTVSTADLRAMSLYLKDKWIGTNSGVDTSEGLHEVSVAAGASCSIDGDVTIADNATVTIGGKGSSLGTVAVDGTVTFGKNVSVSTPDARGGVALISADQFEETASLSTWTCNGARFHYRIADGTLYTEGAGLTIFIR